MNAIRIKSHSFSGLNISKSLRQVYNTFNLIDVWEEVNGIQNMATHFHPQGWAKLDNIYCSQHFKGLITVVQSDILAFSDHKILYASFLQLKTTAACSPSAERCFL